MKQLIICAAILAFGTTVKAQAPTIPADVNSLLQKHTCYTCHHPTKKIVGPAWVDVAGKKYTLKKFQALVAKPEPKNWPGYTAMAPLPNVPKGDLEKIYNWVSTLKK